MALIQVSDCFPVALHASEWMLPHAETIVTPFTADYLSTYLSLCPTPSDTVLSFGPIDMMMSPAPLYLPSRLYSLFPHPAQDASEKRRYIAMLTSRCVYSLFHVCY